MSHEDGNSLNPGLKRKAQNDFNKDTTRFLFFDDKNTVLCSSFKVADPQLELAPLKSIFNDNRESAIRSGVRFNGQRYEVHTFDPPLIYGRSMVGDPVQSEAIAVCRVEAGPTGVPAYGIITFVLPNLTAKMVPQLRQFCNANLRETAH